MIEYLGKCAHCRCSIYYDPIEEERYYESNDLDCRCELQEDLDVVVAIERGLEKKDWQLAGGCIVCGAKIYERKGVRRHTCECVPDYEKEVQKDEK